MACIKRLSCKFCVSGMSLCGSSLWMVLLYFKLFHFRVWFNWLIIGCYLVWDCSFRVKLITLVYLQVVANCLHSLQEIWTLEAANSEAAAREIETLYSKPVVFYLLNKWVSTFLWCFSGNNPNVNLLDFLYVFTHRIKEFSEWAQCLVLELASKFLPSDNNEIFDIMNLLEDRLQHANGAVVLSTIKVFLHLTMSMTDVHQQVHMLLLPLYYQRCNFAHAALLCCLGSI